MFPGSCTAAMRLTEEEQRGIPEAARSVLPAGTSVLPFGSRIREPIVRTPKRSIADR